MENKVEAACIDARLIQVCLGPYQVILNFENRMALSIMSEIVLIDESGVESIVDYRPSLGYINIDLLTNFLEQRIVFVRDVGGTGLELDFTNGYTLRAIKQSNSDTIEIKIGGVFYDF